MVAFRIKVEDMRQWQQSQALEIIIVVCELYAGNADCALRHEK